MRAPFPRIVPGTGNMVKDSVVRDFTFHELGKMVWGLLNHLDHGKLTIAVLEPVPWHPVQGVA